MKISGLCRWLGVLILYLAAGLSVHADGCFVMRPFVWDKHKDINEPTQKAIILHHEGRQDMVLQVKYDGPVEEFGWLVPVPGLPTVEKASMECFYELSRHTQRAVWGTLTATLSSSANAINEKPEPVKVIEIKTVGAYEVAVLSTKDAGSLSAWLEENQFAFPKGGAAVIDEYVRRQWYFVAVKIDLGKGSGFRLLTGGQRNSRPATAAMKEQLSQGELHPLLISFDTEKCVFPLKISSLNGTPSEVQVYTFSGAPLLEQTLLKKELEAARQAAIETRERHLAYERRDSSRYSIPGRTNYPYLDYPSKTYLPQPYVYGVDAGFAGRVTNRELPACIKQFPRLAGKQWLLSKHTQKFAPEEMRDLEFQPAVPVLKELLANDTGYHVAYLLGKCGSAGKAVLLEAMQSTNNLIRKHAAYMAGSLDVPEEAGLVRRLLDDSEVEARGFAVKAVERGWKPEFAAPMLRRFADADGAVAEAAREAMRYHWEDLKSHVPALLELLRGQHGDGQLAAYFGLSALNEKIPRADLLKLLGSPHSKVALNVHGAFRSAPLMPDEARPLMASTNPLTRFMGTRVLSDTATTAAVDLIIPMLRDRDPGVRQMTYNTLKRRTNQEFPADQPARWEAWWAANRATFKVIPSPQR